MKASRLYLLLLLTISVSLVVAACGSGEDEPAAAQQPSVAPQATTAAPVTQAPQAPQATATARPANTPVPPPTATAVPRPQGEFRLAWTSMSNFQGIHLNQSPQYYLDMMCDYVIGSTQDGKNDSVSGLVNAWNMSADGKVWTLKTRDGIVHHNGDKATAKDVKYWVDFSKSSESTLSTRANLQNDLVSIEAPDANTVVVTLKARNIFWPFAFVGRYACGGNPCYVMPADYVARVTPAGANKNPIGSGPYKMKEILVGNSVTFEAADNHWFWGVPRIKTIYWALVPEENTQVALLRNNEVHLANLSVAGGKALANARNVKIYSRPGGTANLRVEQQYIKEYAGYGKNPIADVKVRQALVHYGIDRQALADTYMGGFAKPDINWPANSADPSYEKLPVPPYDVNRAKALLTEAGYPRGFEMDMYIWPRPDLPEGIEMMEGIAVMWERLGIKVNRKPIDFAAFISVNLAARKFDRPSVSGMFGLGLYPFAAGQGTAGFADNNQFVQSDDAELRAMVADWVSSASIDDYIRLGRQANRLIADRVAHTPALLTFDRLLGGRSDVIPASWGPSRDLFSFGVERIGLQPKTWTADRVS